MKKLKLLIVWLLTFLVTAFSAACGGGSLAVPTGIDVDIENTLTWNEVDDARRYAIEIVSVADGGRTEVSSRVTSYSLSALTEGDYEIRLRAVGGGQNETLYSPWSEVYAFHRDYETGCVYQLINEETEYRVYRVGTATGTITIEDVYRGKPVTEIADAAFRSSSLEGIVLGNNIRSIGKNAFYNSKKLTSVVIPESVTFIGESVFNSCSALKSVVLPSGVTDVPDFAFSSCVALESVTLGDKVERIGKQAFYNCTALRDVNIPDSVTTIDEAAFHYQASAQPALTEIKFGAGLQTVGSEAFYGQTQLKTLDFSANAALETIGPSAFIGCTSLTDVTFPESGALSLGESSFAYCTALTSVGLTGGVADVDNYAFMGCAKLETVEIGGNVTHVGYGVFESTPLYEGQTGNGFIYADGWLVDCADDYLKKTDRWAISSEASTENITRYPLKDGTVGIADNSFYGAVKLEQVTLPYSVKYVGKYAFAYNSALTRFATEAVAGNGGLIKIGEAAFAWTTNLSNVYLRNGLEEIDNYAFYGCSSLVNSAYPDRITPESLRRIGRAAFYQSGIWDTNENGIVYAGYWAVGYDLEAAPSITVAELRSDDDNALRGISDYAFTGWARLQSMTGVNGAEIVGTGAFYYCSSLVSVTLNNDIREIADFTFDGCSALVRVTLPERLRSIGRYAFYQCASLRTIETRSNPQLDGVDLTETELESIGERAFYGARFDKILFGEDIKEIGDYAFYGNAYLQSLELPATVTSIGEYSFSACTALKTVTLGENLTEIPDGAFSSCLVLEEIKIPDKTERVGNYAFYGCILADTLDLGRGVKEIGDYAFYGNAFSSVSIPVSVATIGASAFRDCYRLQSFVLHGKVETVGSLAFYGCPRLTLFVAGGTEIAAKWSEDWNVSFRPVVWGCELSEDGKYVVSLTVGEGTVSNAYAWGGVNAPARAGYDFVGWALSPAATQADYTAAELSSVAPGTTVYAIWKEAEAEPSPEPSEPESSDSSSETSADELSLAA